MNVVRATLLSSLVLMSFTACQSTAHHPKVQADSAATMAAQNLEVRFLTQEEAQARAKRLSQIHYQLNVDLTGDKKNFKGDMLITFELSDISSDLKLDSTDSEITKIRINGQDVTKWIQAKRSILLPQSLLKQGYNEVAIQYVEVYSHSGEGLHRFEDPEDKKEYLYTQFEDFDANRFMPCFDQPDLKAKLQLTVLAPAKWQVITANYESSKHKISKQIQKWIFPDTPLISTYLYSLHAGDFKVWKSNFGKIPLRLFVRQSLAKYVTAEDWFKITREGLGFYQDYFAIDYPFFKYDQLVLPEFNAGAMENVAAVTFSERMIFRGKQTRDERSNTAETILHEMAHMWFGDLVTMKWWNDLWLNESFADFMENLATQGATEFKDADLDAFFGEKQWAYQEDQLITTHPIEASVKNTDEAFLNFDGITYGKGSAVFKQLKYKIGADTFREGVRQYFKKYSYKNTDLADFMAELSAASRQDLGQWSKGWLQDSGVDTLKFQIKCEAQKVKSLDLEILNPDTAKQNRVHAFEIAFLTEQGSRMKVSQNFRVVMNQKKMSVADAIGQECPKMVYPNYHDNDYIKFQLDGVTIANLRISFSKVEDPFLRLMFSTTLWQMVRDRQFKIGDYSEIALKATTTETDSKVLKQLVFSISGGKHYDDSCVYFFMPNDTPDERLARQKFVALVENTYYENFKKSKLGSDEQMTWFESLTHATETPTGLNRLAQSLDSKSVSGPKVDQDRRWLIVQQLCKFKDPRAPDILASEEKLDTSNRAKDSYLACMASLPNLENKKFWYEKVKAEKSDYSLEQIGQIARNLFPYQQRDLKQTFADDYFNFISNSFNRDQEYLSAIAKELAPAMCNEKSASRIKAFVAVSPQMPAVLVKQLKVLAQEDGRCAKVQAYNRL